jgi:hypothetical protein
MLGLTRPKMAKGKDMYLRIDSALNIPVLALQSTYWRIPIELREADELADSVLLLRRVGWRHLVLAKVALVQVSNSFCAQDVVIAGLRSRIERRRGSAETGRMMGLRRRGTKQKERRK